jgi:HAD superfamily hydrolase (TIGR01509 family)
MVKACIFDMDGVLINSVEIGLRVRTQLLHDEYGVDLSKVPDPEGEAHRAASTKDPLGNVEKYYGVSIDPEKFAAKSRAYIYEELRHVPIDPKLKLFLDELKRYNVTCANVSSGQRKGVELKLNILCIKHYFSVIVTGNDVEAHKPHPAPYLFVLKKLRLPAEDCVIFEDSLTGVRAGRAAGCRVIGVTKYNPIKMPLPGTITSITSWGEIDYNKLKRL